MISQSASTEVTGGTYHDGTGFVTAPSYSHPVEDGYVRCEPAPRALLKSLND